MTIAQGMLNHISKIWIINLALVAAMLFVYGGLHWFDSKDPEATNTKAPEGVKADVSFTQKLSDFFSFSGSKKNANQGAEEVEYGYTEDGLGLPIAKQDFNTDSSNEDLSGITSNTKENQARLNQVIGEIAQANQDLSQLVLLQNQQPDNQEINATIEEAENNLYALQDERESLMALIRKQQSGHDEF